MLITSCRICGQELDVHQRIKGICGAPACRRRDVPYQQQKHDQSVRAQVAEVAKNTWQLEARVTLVPYEGSDITPLPDRRRHAFVGHLRQIVMQAMRRRDAGEPPLKEHTRLERGITPEQAELKVLGAACSVCGGQCCNRGNTRAWLNVASFERLLKEHDPFKEMTADEIVEHYLGFLPESSHEGSCVFHAAEGCTLPRDIRSSVCNEYFCAGIAELFNHLDKPEATTIVASVSGAVIKRMAHFSSQRVEKSLDMTTRDDDPGDSVAL